MKKIFLSILLAASFLLIGCDQEDASNGSVVDGSSVAATAHVDGNDDGTCDKCNETVTVTVDILAINDLHGKFEDTNTQPGVDEMSTYIKQVRAENPNTILLSSGDMWQGSPESNLTKGNLITEWMNEMDFASMTLGNHEYDWGESYISQNAALAEFPILGVNVFEKNSNKRKEYCQPSTVVELGDLKVGIIGAQGDVISSISADKVEDVEFRTGGALTSLVKMEADRLREEEGVDFIIYSVHDGNSKYDETLSKGYVDIVFEGHTHSAYVEKDGKGVYHLQGGGDNKRGLSHAEVKINYVTGTSVVLDAELVSHNQYAHLADDPVVDTLQEKYKEQIAPMHEVLGYNDTVRGSQEIKEMTAQLYLEAALEKWGNDYDIVLASGTTSVRAPYELARGEVKYGDLMNLLPFDNEIMLCKVSGSKLLTRFINNGDYTLHFSEYGNSIKENIDTSKSYYIVVDRYSSLYSPNGLTEVAMYDKAIFARDLYAQYIREGGLGSSGEYKTLTIAEAIELGDSKANNEYTTERYYITGTVADTPQATYGNFNLMDENGNTIYVYGLYDQENNRYDSMAKKPVKGNTITVLSVVGKYNDNPRLKEATLIEIAEGNASIDWSKVPEITIREALLIGDALADNAQTKEYVVRGKIVSIEPQLQGKPHYGNMTIVDDEGNELYVYGTYDSKGNVYGDMENPPQVGDEVILGGTIKKYVKQGNPPQIELVSGIFLEMEQNADNKTLTIAEAIELGDSKANGEYTTEKYYITGRVANTPNQTYGNFNLVDEYGNTIYVYGLYDQENNRYDSMADKPLKGDKITLLSVVGKFGDNPRLKEATVVELVYADNTEALKSAAETLGSMYADQHQKTWLDYTVTDSITIDDVLCTITWSVDVTEGVTVVQDGYTILIDIDETLTEDLSYVLTATITARGSTPQEVAFSRIAQVTPVLVSAPIETSPADGGNYKLYMYQVTTKTDYYFTGKMKGYYLAISTKFEEAVDVTATRIGETVFNLSVTDKNGATKYIGAGNSYSSGSWHYNILLEDSPEVADGEVKSFMWKFNPTYKTMTIELKGVKEGNDVNTQTTKDITLFMGSESTYNTVGVYDLAEITKEDACVAQLVSMVDRNSVATETKVEKTVRDLSINPVYVGANDVTLDTQGTTYPDTTIAWTVEGEGATVENGVLKIAEPTASTTLTLKATVTNGNVEEKVEFTVMAVPNTAEAILAAAKTLKSGETFGNAVELEGLVFSISQAYDAQYGTVAITMLIGEEKIDAYRLAGNGADLLAKGYTVKVSGIITNYNGTVQFNQGCEIKSYVVGDEANLPQVQGTVYDFATYEKGVQYAEETHKLDDVLSMHIVACHLTSELRIYQSKTNDGIATFTSTKVIKKIVLNAGNNADTLNVYGSTDGENWTLIEGVATAKEYADYTLDVSAAGYKYLKLDAVSKQIRVKSITVEYAK